MILLALLLWCATVSAQERAVTEVRIRGNLRVESDLILAKISSRPGEPYDGARIRQDIQAIYSLGYFDDILVELDEQGALVFVVRERPALRDWRTEGSDAVDDEDVEKAVPLKRREILDEARVEEGARAILDLYREKGFYLAEVTPEVERVPDGKNHVDVIYRIDAGRKVRVKDVNLMGVERVDSKKIRRYMATKEAGRWSWLTGSGKFTETDLERDREVIRSYYLNHGFVDAEISEPLVTLTRDRKWLKVDIPIREGESFRVDEIMFSGDLEFSEEELRAAAGLKEGDTFRSDDFRKANQRLNELYADIGYAFVEIDPKTDIDREALTISLDFQIHKGELVHIGRIEVRGNTKTRDRVVRRDVRLSEGELFSARAISESRRAIENLGFFEQVNVTTHRRPGTNLVDVDVQVEEKPTGSFSVGAGYSSVDKIIFMGSISQRNFLGFGYQLSAQANFGTTRESYSLTFNNPRVFDTRWYAGFDLYNTTREFTDYDKDAIGGAVKLGTALGRRWRTRWIYRLEKATVDNVKSGASRVIQDQKGTRVTSSITPTLTYDSLDNQWEPHNGILAELSIEWAGGVLGGDNAFLKYGFDGRKYFPLWWDTVFHLHGRIGFIQALEGEPIPLYERYVLGGINTLRGFDSRSIGPEDDGDVIGGDKELLFNVEYLFPLIKQAKVRGVVFFDAGNAWDVGSPYFASGLRTSVGGGVRWISPMGPLRLEWGYVLDPKDDEDHAQWEFSIGGFF